jgi:hypothetical protein
MLPNTHISVKLGSAGRLHISLDSTHFNFLKPNFYLGLTVAMPAFREKKERKQCWGIRTMAAGCEAAALRLKDPRKKKGIV